jgi:DNA-binding XRE family transcriptional regulator
MERRRRPKKAVVYFRSVAYGMDIQACVRAVVRCQVAGEFATMDELADAAGISRSTVSRFLQGRPTSLGVARSILDKLQITFDEVFRPHSGDR